MWYEVRFEVPYFLIQYPVVPASFVVKAILTPLNYLGTFVKNQSTVYDWVYF